MGECKQNCKCGKQIQIGQNGEVVTISLTEYEELLENNKRYKQYQKLYKNTRDNGITKKENSKD